MGRAWAVASDLAPPITVMTASALIIGHRHDHRHSPSSKSHSLLPRSYSVSCSSVSRTGSPVLPWEDADSCWFHFSCAEALWDLYAALLSCRLLGHLGHASTTLCLLHTIWLTLCWSRDSTCHSRSLASPVDAHRYVSHWFSPFPAAFGHSYRSSPVVP